MKFPYLSKRKADTISNGFFLILTGFLLYANSLWPGILFAIGASFALRQFLTGRRVEFFITVAVVGVLSFITLLGQTFHFILPLFFIGLGSYIILKEYFSFNGAIPLNKKDEG